MGDQRGDQQLSFIAHRSVVDGAEDLTQEITGEAGGVLIVGQDHFCRGSDHAHTPSRARDPPLAR